MSQFFLFLVEEAGERLDLFLSRKTGQSRRFVKDQIESGRVRLNQQTGPKPAHKLRVGDEVSGEFEEEYRTELVPIAFPLAILFEDEDLLAINKPPGMVVHPAAGHRGETLVHYLLYHFKNSSAFTATSATRPGIVHRLDRGTSGVLLVAKHRRALESLSAQFKSRTIRKEYECVAWGKLPLQGTFQSPVGRDPRDRHRMSSKGPTAREALTRYETHKAYPHFAHLRLLPHTGRTHQLRVHLTENGNPIVGDPLYGKSSLGRRKLAVSPVLRHAVESLSHTLLHARALWLDHPLSGAKLHFEAPRPAVFDEFLLRLEESDR